jgi:hypothetical protein
VRVQGSLDERPVHRGLVGIGVEVDLLVRVPSVQVGRDVTGDRDQRHRVQGRRGDAGDRVHHAGADVQQDYAGFPRGAGVSVGGVGGRLLVPGDHELDRAAGQRVQHGDVGVAAGAEHVAHVVPLQQRD